MTELTIITIIMIITIITIIVIVITIIIIITIFDKFWYPRNWYVALGIFEIEFYARAPFVKITYEFD